MKIQNPQTDWAVLKTVLFYSVLILVLPIGSFFATKSLLFEWFLGQVGNHVQMCWLLFAYTSPPLPPPPPTQMSNLVCMLETLLSLCRRQQSGQTLCRLSLLSSSFTLHWVSSFTRYTVNKFGNTFWCQFWGVLLQAYFDDGKKSIKSDWRGYFFSEIRIGEASLSTLIYENFKEQKAELVWWPVELLSVMFCHFSVRTVVDTVLQFGQRSDHSWRYQGDYYYVLHLSCNVEVQSEVKYMIKLSNVCIVRSHLS